MNRGIDNLSFRGTSFGRKPISQRQEETIVFIVPLSPIKLPLNLMYSVKKIFCIELRYKRTLRTYLRNDISNLFCISFESTSDLLRFYYCGKKNPTKKVDIKSRIKAFEIYYRLGFHTWLLYTYLRYNWRLFGNSVRLQSACAFFRSKNEMMD